jgi:hypothetical protein
VLYSFQSTSDGFEPFNLISDAAGNFYGVTIMGGASSKGCPGGCGGVFEVSPQQGGGWTKTTLYSFTGVPGGAGIGDGSEPIALAFDTKGNLFGSAAWGGYCQGYEGGSCFGAVFELVPPQNQGGAWTESVAYRFSAGLQNPVSGIAIDSSGTLYGATYVGVYQLSLKGGEHTLYTFAGNGDGIYPYGGVTLNPSGNLFGTTIGGGTAALGIVFQLTRPATKGGAWTETILHSFAGGSDGSAPDAPVTIENGGVLYGTTLRGGSSKCNLGYGNIGCGTVFEIVP